MATGVYDIRCSVVVLRKHEVLLLRRTGGERDDWALPGGTPREEESAAECARRELLEETGVSADVSRVALVVESAIPGSGRHQLDIVFLATEPVLGREFPREPGLEPRFVSSGRLPDLVLHPPVAGHLIRLLDPGISQHAPYVGNLHGNRERQPRARKGYRAE
jgi:ADP-ribose pyrophosphatase YjhB (NUDIX family)